MLQAAAVGALLAFTMPAAAQPTGATVIAGQATVLNPSAASTIINQSSAKAIINWQDFSVGAGASVQFNQPDAASLTLNRVVGSGLSAIEGSIKANGQVWLINPNGVLFGNGAQVNVGGLLATTSDIANADFLSGNYAFAGAPAGSSVINKGTLQAGSVVLSAPKVANSGLIAARAGHVVLGGASAFTVDFKGDHLLSYAVSAPAKDAEVSNSGTIKAGTVLMTARAASEIARGVVNNSGIIEATSARMENGEIVLDAGDGEAVNSGTLDASGKNAGETGGTVKMLGKTVTVADGAAIDVSGDAGGGTAAIGGNLHGTGSQNAQTVTVGKASIKADAITSGHGGTVAVYGTGQTRVAASISARGGTKSGNGGQIETSGHALYVDDATSIVTAAPKGTSGNWLLDPQNIVISTGGTESVSQTFATTGNTATISPATINSALGSGNVTLQANTDITVSSDLTITALTANRLTLDAGRSVILSGGGITYLNGSVSLIGNDPAAVASDRLAGSANLVSNNFAVNASSVDLTLFTDVATGSIGSSSKSFNVRGQTYVKTSGANTYLATADNSLTLGNSGHALAVDMGTGDLTIASNGVVQAAPLSVHSLSISLLAGTNATGNPVTLTNVSNAITGTVSVAARGGSFGGANQIEVVNNGALSVGAITVTPNPTGNGDYGAVSLTSKTSSLTLTGAVSGGGITLNGGTFVLEAAGGTFTSHHTGDNTIAGSVAINAGGGITLANANTIEQIVAATGNGNQTNVLAPGQLAFGAGGVATITVGNSIALYAASAGGAMTINATGSVNLSDAGGNTVVNYSAINILNPVTSAGFLTLNATGDIRQLVSANGDVHITTTAGLAATSANGIISLTDGGHGGANPDVGNRVSGVVKLGSHGDTSFTNTINTVLGGPTFADGALPNGYVPPDSFIGGNLNVLVTDAGQTGGNHSNLVLAGQIHTQNDAGITVLHASGDLINNNGSGTIYADNLSLVSDFGAVGGDDGTHWTFGLGDNSGAVQNLHVAAAGAIVINPGAVNIGVTGLNGGLTGQSVLIFSNGAVTQSSDVTGVIATDGLDIHSFSGGNIILDNANNRVTGGVYLRTAGDINFTNSVTTTINQLSGDGLDPGNAILKAANVTVTVQDPNGVNHPDLNLGIGTDYDANGNPFLASIEASGNVVLNADGGITDNYVANSATAGHVVAPSLFASAGSGSVTLLNPATTVGTFGAVTNNQLVSFTTNQTGDLVIGNSGVQAGNGPILLHAPNARLLGSDPIIGNGVGLVAASMLINELDAQTLSAYTSGGDIQIASSGTINVKNLAGAAGINSQGGAVLLFGDIVTQATDLTGAIIAGSLEAAASTSVALNSTANAVSGSLVLVSGGDASITNSITTHLSTSTAVGKITVQSAGDLVIDQSAGIFSQAGSGDSVVLVAGANFINNSGSAAVVVQGNARWLIYSASPSNDVFKNLNSNNNAVFNTTYPTPVTQTGNRYVFASRPTITVTAGDLSKIYGNDIVQTVAADYTVSGGNIGVQGAYLGDTQGGGFSGTPSITSPGAAATADVGSYAIKAGQGSFQAANGYNIVFVDAQLTVGKRTLTAVLQGPVSKTYDGTTVATLAINNYALNGVANTDAVTLANFAGGLYADADAGTNKTVSVTGLSLTGAKAGNYTLTNTSASGTVGTILQKALTLTLVGTTSKTFDGTTAATLTDANYSALGGVVGQDAVTLGKLPTSGTYQTASVGTEKTVSVTGLTLSGAKAGNYAIPETVSGAIGIILAARGQGNIPGIGDGSDTPKSEAQIITATVANQNANQPTRPGSFYLDVGTGPVVQAINDTTTAPVPAAAILTPAAINPIAEMAADTSSTGSSEVEPATSADQASDFLVTSMNGGPGTGGVLIPGLLRTAPRRQGSGMIPNNLSAWGNSALWQ